MEPEAIPASSNGSHYPHLGCLPDEIYPDVLQFLTPTDDVMLARTLMLASTCRHFAGLARDRVMLHRLFFFFTSPHSKFTTTSLCDVLGIPLAITRYPSRKRSTVNYCSNFDIISAPALSGTAWIPLYLTHSHFLRGLPALQNAVVRLSFRWDASSFHPMMAVEVLRRLMNTTVVRMCDQDACPSDRMLWGYCQLHRLLIAIVAHYPGLAEEIHLRLKDFALNEEARHKASTPSLGEFLPLLAVSSTVGWEELGQELVNEAFDRGVRWAFRAAPSLWRLERYSKTDWGTVMNEDQISKEWAASQRVNMRVIMFHVNFLRRFGPSTPPPELGQERRSLVQIAERYDQLYGLPSLQQRCDFRRNIAKIFKVSDWVTFFQWVCLPCPSSLTDWLEECISRSAEKGYHRPLKKKKKKKKRAK